MENVLKRELPMIPPFQVAEKPSDFLVPKFTTRLDQVSSLGSAAAKAHIDGWRRLPLRRSTSNQRGEGGSGGSRTSKGHFFGCLSGPNLGKCCPTEPKIWTLRLSQELPYY